MKVLPVNYIGYSYRNNIQNKKTNFAQMPHSAQNSTYNIPFYGYWVRDIDEKYINQQDEIINKMVTFFQSDKGGHLIAQSANDSRVYEIDSLPGIIIKSKNGLGHEIDTEAKFTKEIQRLLPNSGQGYIATITDEDTGRNYIISTKIEGQKADPKKSPWTPEKLKIFFDSLLVLDKANLWHGDLSINNILLGEDKIGIIDCSWTKKLPKENNFVDKLAFCNLPSFAYMMNSAQFEMTGLPEYILKFDDCNEAKEFFKDYLQAKSQYHKQRSEIYNYVTATDEDGHTAKKLSREYDYAQYIVLKNPSEEVMKVEAKKVQFLNAYKQAFNYQNNKSAQKNIFVAPAAVLYTLSCIQDYRRELQIYKEKISNTSMDDETKNAVNNYIESMEKYGNWWLFNINLWAADIAEMPLNFILKENEDWDGTAPAYEKFDTNKYKNYGNISDILPVLGDDYESKYTKETKISSHEYENLIRDSKKYINLLNSAYESQEKQDSSYLWYKNFYNTGINKNKCTSNNDFFNTLSGTCLQLKYAYDYLKSLEAEDVEPADRYKYEQRIKPLIEINKKLIKSIFRAIYIDIMQDGPATKDLTGYKGMSKFCDNYKRNIEQELTGNEPYLESL